MQALARTDLPSDRTQKQFKVAIARIGRTDSSGTSWRQDIRVAGALSKRERKARRRPHACFSTPGCPPAIASGSDRPGLAFPQLGSENK